MSPLESNQVLVQFNAAASPWWLLLLLPLSALLAWWLYRPDAAGLPRGHRVALRLLRVGLIVALIFLAFRPDLIHRRTLTYPGRVAVVIDDSRSMTARDDRMSDVQALQWARTLRIIPDDPDAPFHGMAEHARALAGELRSFERWSRGIDRSSDAFWDHAGRVQQSIEQRFTQLSENAARPIAERIGPDAIGIASQVDAAVGELRVGAVAFFVGDRLPGDKMFDEYDRSLDALIHSLDALQAMLDQQRLVQGDESLRRRVNETRGLRRLELAGAKLRAAAPKLSTLAPRQGFELVGLVSRNRHSLDAAAVTPKASPGGTTDLVGRLTEIAEEPSDFPLAAIVLISDGIDIAQRSAEPLRLALSRHQAPVLAAAVGADIEPSDVAIVDLVAPPIAIAARPVAVQVIVRSALARVASTRVELLHDGKVIATQSAELPAVGQTPVTLTFTPTEPGVSRYTARVAPLAGEVFPTENNQADLVLNVRAEPVRVLLVDFTARWQTRFVINVLQRMPYVDLDSIVLVARDNPALPRGSRRGDWPDTQAGLGLYDLVIVGDLPPGTLTAADREQLRAWVEKQGGTLVSLAPAHTGSDAIVDLQGKPERSESGGGLVSAQIPIATQPADPLQRIDQLALTSTGRAHPLTLDLARPLDQFAASDRAATSHVAPALTTLLLDHRTREPIITWQPMGRGKALRIHSNQLWLALNPTAHRAHVQMFIELVTWAVEGGRFVGGDQPSAQGLAIDRQRARSDQPVQVWTRNLPTGSNVKASADAGAIAESTVPTLIQGQPLNRVEFTSLPPRDLKFIPTDPDSAMDFTPVVHVIEDDAELKQLARNDATLQQLAGATGGQCRPLIELERLLQSIEPKQRIDRQDRIWRLWDAPLVLALLVLTVTVEWVWRKLVGLV